MDRFKSMASVTNDLLASPGTSQRIHENLPIFTEVHKSRTTCISMLEVRKFMPRNKLRTKLTLPTFTKVQNLYPVVNNTQKLF